MSDPDGPATSPEQPEPTQPAPDQPTLVQPAAAQPVPVQPTAAPVAAPVTPAAPPAASQRGTGFTVLVAGATALVVALVVAAGTAFAVTRHADSRPHRVMVDVQPADGMQRLDGPGRPGQMPGQMPGQRPDGQERGSRVDGQDRRGPGADSQGGRESDEQGPTDSPSSGS